MKKTKGNIQVQGIGFLITITGLLKYLWNKLFPELFGTKKISYWQSIMLYLICKALFDFRYNIKDSFNFGNNTINGEKSEKTDKKDNSQSCQNNIKEESEIEVEITETEDTSTSQEPEKAEVKSEEENDNKEV